MDKEPDITLIETVDGDYLIIIGEFRLRYKEKSEAIDVLEKLLELNKRFSINGAECEPLIMTINENKK